MLRWKSSLKPAAAASSYTLEETFADDSANEYGWSKAASTTYVGTLVAPASSYTATRLEFYLKKTGTGGGTITAEIWSATGSAGSETPDALLATSTTTVAASGVSATEDWISFDFAGQAIASGTNYFFVMKTPTPGDTSNYYKFTLGSSYNTTNFETVRGDATPTWAVANGGRGGYCRSYSGGGGGGSTFPSTSLVAFYKLDESSGDALDSSGNSKTFTETGTVAATTGTIGGETVNVRTLDRPAGEYFSRTDDADFDVADGEDFTIAFWAKVSSSMGNYNTGGIFSKRHNVTASDAGYQICLRNVNGDTRVRYNAVCDGTTTVGDSDTDTGFATDVWGHYMMVFTADATLVTYVNNVQYDSEDVSSVTGSLANAKNNYIGQLAHNSNGSIIADVTHLGFWSIALNSSERTALYNSGKVLAPGSDGANNNFDFTVTTTTSSETFTIRCNNSGTFDATVDWGDESTSAITAYDDADLTHTYATADDYDISISGTFPNIYFNGTGDRAKVKSVTNLGSVGWTSFFGSFKGCSNMTSFDAGDCDTSSATNVREMLRSCSSLTSLDLSNFDTSGVNASYAMYHTFSGCSSLTSLDLSGFDTSSVTDMRVMFDGCTSLTSLDVSSFDTSSVTAMQSMFKDCSSLTSLDVTSFDTSGVTTMKSMFEDCSSLTSLDVSDFDTSSVTSMQSMFKDCENITSLDVSSFDTSSVTAMQSMFNDCENITSLDVSSFDTSSATNMSGMFRECSSLTSIDLSSFDTSSVTNISLMFWACSSSTSIDVSSFDTSSVTNMKQMFSYCSALTSLDVSSFDTSSVTDMKQMFQATGGGTAQLTITGIEDFDITAVSTDYMTNLMSSTGGLSTTVYDELLVNWEGQTGYNNQNPHFGSSKYTAGGAAATARADLVTAGWSITDGGYIIAGDAILLNGNSRTYTGGVESTISTSGSSTVYGGYATASMYFTDATKDGSWTDDGSGLLWDHSTSATDWVSLIGTTGGTFYVYEEGTSTLIYSFAWSGTGTWSGSTDQYGTTSKDYTGTVPPDNTAIDVYHVKS